MNFASDNTAGIARPILDALTAANEGFTPGYGDDDLTRSVERRLAEVFEREVAVFLVPTGTAANVLAISHCAPPWGAVLCHAESHVNVDECGAPEFFGGGLKLVGLAGEGCKLLPATVKGALEAGPWGGPHHVAASVLSLTQATEAGTLYRAEEVRALCDIAHAHGLAVHMDGARFGNAVAQTNGAPADLTWRAGVDVLSFGATKGGALAAEAVVFFDPKRAEGMASRRKRGAQLVSKHRFLAAQFAAYLKEDLWLTLARHANAAAAKLARGLADAGCAPAWPVEANEIFAPLSKAADTALRKAGARYYPWVTRSLPAAMTIPADRILVRLVTSFATTDAEVDQFVQIVAGHQK